MLRVYCSQMGIVVLLIYPFLSIEPPAANQVALFLFIRRSFYIILAVGQERLLDCLYLLTRKSIILAIFFSFAVKINVVIHDKHLLV